MAKSKSSEKKEKQEIHVDLNDKLVFSRFNALSTQRNSLYSDYIEIDEPDEIGQAWIRFSGDVVHDLLSVVELTKSLFERMIDEHQRSKEEPDEKSFEKIKNLTDFWLDLSVMSYLYATIEKRGVLDQSGLSKNTLGYVDTKKSIDELILLAFELGDAYFTDDARLTLKEVLSLDQDKKRLDWFDDLELSDEQKNQLLGMYDQRQANFLMTRVYHRLVRSSATWWWKDSIGMHSAAEHAISHIMSMVSFWEKSSSDMQGKGQAFHAFAYPVARVNSDVALAQHYRRLAMSALDARATSAASEYFAKAASLTASLGLENLGIVDQIGLWNRSIPEQYLIYEQMRHLATITSNYNSIIHYLKEGKVEETKILIPELLRDLTKILSLGDVAYVSSVAVAYDTVFAYILQELDKNTDVNTIVKFVEERINIVAERLKKASHQKTMNWIKSLTLNSSDIRTLNEIVYEIDLPRMALYILPERIKFVSSIAKELQSIEIATEVLTLGILADQEFGQNPVKEMLIRSKVYQLSIVAYNLLENVEDPEITGYIKEIILPLSQNALIRGLIAEVQLRSAVLQYRFINSIAPIIENSSLAKARDAASMSLDIDELNHFSESLNELNVASETIMQNQAPVTIGGQPLNWNFINRVQFYSKGLSMVIKSVVYAIQAVSFKKSEVEDAITAWDSAKTITFEAADIVANARTQDSENISQQVYSLAQLYNGYENNARSYKQGNPFPIEGVVELINALTMSL